MSGQNRLFHTVVAGRLRWRLLPPLLLLAISSLALGASGPVITFNGSFLQASTVLWMPDIDLNMMIVEDWTSLGLADGPVAS
jgi:hypothetical protein